MRQEAEMDRRRGKMTAKTQTLPIANAIPPRHWLAAARWLTVTIASVARRCAAVLDLCAVTAGLPEMLARFLLAYAFVNFYIRKCS